MKRQTLATRLSMAAGALLLAGAAHANLVTNPGFETGNFSGWTQFGNTGTTGVSGGAFVHTGSFGAFFGPIGSTGGIFQTLTTTPGATYLVDYWLFNRSGETPNSFAFNWDGGAAEQSLTNAAAFAYTHFTFSLVASSASTDLRFTFRHDPNRWGLDDVSVNQVTAVPEPATLGLVLVALFAAALVRRRASASV